VDDSQFWRNLDALAAAHRVVIDRPKGTTHPRFPEFFYPFDYGYLEGTTGGDGQGIDVWVGSGDSARITAVVCTVDMEKRDAELKLLLGCTEAEAQEILGLHNSGPQAALLVMKPGDRLSGS
jgi:inorganic pyrophosphatase